VKLREDILYTVRGVCTNSGMCCGILVFNSKACFFWDAFGFEQVACEFVDIFSCGCGWVGFEMFVSFLIIQHFVNLVAIPLCLWLRWYYLCRTWWWVYLNVAMPCVIFWRNWSTSFFFFYGWNHFFREIRSASLGEMPRKLSSTEARVSFTSTSLRASAKICADADACCYL